MKLDVVIISASRPKLIPYLIKTIDSKLHFDHSIRFLLHEDFVYPDESKKVIDFANSTNKFDKIITDKPNVGIGLSIWKMLEQVKSDYVLMLQDDWEFELPLDLNQILWTMYKNPSINCLCFNKRKNIKTIDGFSFKEYRFNHMLTLLHYHWPLGPGIWKTSYVKDKWEISAESKPQEGHWNKILKNGNKDIKTLEEIGSYIYGPLGFPRVMRHLGATWVTKPWGKWKRKKDGYGGNAELEFKPSSVQNRAPWLPDSKERPKYLENKQDQIKEMKKKNLL